MKEILKDGNKEIIKDGLKDGFRDGFKDGLKYEFMNYYFFYRRLRNENKIYKYAT